MLNVGGRMLKNPEGGLIVEGDERILKED